VTSKGALAVNVELHPAAVLSNDVRAVEADRLADAQARAIEHTEDQEVALADGVADHVGDLELADDALGEPAPLLAGSDRGTGIEPR